MVYATVASCAYRWWSGGYGICGEPEGKVDFVVEGEGDALSYQIHCTRNKIKVETIGE